MTDDSQKPPSLSTNWVYTSLQEILETFQSGGRPKGGVKNITEGIPSLGGEHLLYSGGFDFENIRFIPKDYYESMTKGKIAKNDVLVVKDGATTGKTSFVPAGFPFDDAAVNEHIFILRVNPEFIAPKYLFFWMQSAFGQKCVSDNFQGTAQGGITSSFAQNSQFPLCPVSEQYRIVAKIEELFTQLEAGVAALKRIQIALKRHKVSVLKAACEGRLVPQDPTEGNAQELLRQIASERRAKWEADLRARGKDPKKEMHSVPVGSLDTDSLSELPQEWAYARVDQIGIVQLGRQRSPKHHSGPHMRSYLRAANITWSGLDLSDVMKMNFPPADFAAYQLAIGDVLLSEASGSPSEVGKPAVWGGEIPDCCFQNTIIRVRTEGPFSAYLYIHFLKDAITERFGTISKGVGIHHLGAERISAMAIAIPPLAEQQRIVNEVERRLSAAKALETSIEHSLSRAMQLRQMILQRAFEGRLVPQDPADEPAEKLLERIQAARREKAEQKPARPIRKERKMSEKSKRKRSLFQVLTENGARLTPEDLFQKAGFDENTVDEFYEELRVEIQNGRIHQVRPDEAVIYLERAQT